MKLIKYLRKNASENTSYVQAYLAKEDLKRVEKLASLAETSETVQIMEKDGLYIEWTKDDMRTHDVAEPLKDLIHKIYRYKNANTQKEKDKLDDLIMDVWTSFHTLRLKVLVHCL